MSARGKGAAALAVAVIGSFALGLATVEQPIEAQAAMTAANLNGGIIRFCENQRGDNWVSTHAPRNHKFFHQEVVLGEGTYSIAMIPNGNFRFNAFVYAEGDRYIGGGQNVANHLQNLRVGSGNAKFLIQLVKTSDACPGCSVTMSLTARNCPGRSAGSPAPPPSRMPCQPNYCFDNGGIYGLNPPRCVPKPGSRGGYC